MRSLAIAAVVLATGIGASSASGADGFSLQLTGPADVTVGRPVILTVNGTKPPPDQWWFASWLGVDLLRPAAVPTCPSDSGQANQLAVGTGGNILTIAQREDTDANGNFQLKVGFTPIVTGPLLICAYSYNEEGGTLATASFTVTVHKVKHRRARHRKKRHPVVR